MASSSEIKVPFIDMGAVNAPYTTELKQAFERVLSTSQFVGGPEVEKFEEQLANYVGARYAVGFNSGTSALQLALLAANIGPGDEVILPANTFFATAEAVVACGATPVLVDCNERTALLDADATEAAITERTAAVIPVHLYGQPVNMDAFRELADRRSLFLLEDNAQAIGATWNGKMTGCMGDASAFSFYPGKNLGALGEGGAVTTSDELLRQRMDILRNHGSERKYQHDAWGFNERLHGLQAAFLAAKLPHLSTAQTLRNQAVAKYKDLLSDNPAIEWLETADKAVHVWHLLIAQVNNRDDVLQSLQTAGIQCGIHYPTPIHLTGAANGELGKLGDFPNAERLANSIISLPLWAGISEEQITLVANALKSIIR